jgi:DNA ligase-1
MQPTSKGDIEIENWFMSEKYDGMKARWINGILYTRSNAILYPPESFVKCLPNFDIEGELYFGKNTFHKIGSLKSKTCSEAWNKVVFKVFDLINYKYTWFKRHIILYNACIENNRVELVKWYLCKNNGALEKFFKKITKIGGEGVIIANPYGKYVDGYTKNILKYKIKNDCEAVVIGYKLDGNRLMSLKVKNSDNIIFYIGTGLKMIDRYNYKEKFPIGILVSYTYELLSKSGKPRTPVLKGVRNDL